MKESQNIKVIAVLGPTASGKSTLAMNIARKFGGVILNCDSRQIYREMDIGTAKPTENERKQVEHHLFDLINPDETFSAGDYQALAARSIRNLSEQKKLCVLTGGTGFYYNAIADGLPATSSDPETVKQLQQQLQEKGLEFLRQRLLEIDPQAYNNIDLNNSRRVMRAIEVVLITGRPFSENLPQKPLPEADFLPIVVTRPRNILHSRIEIRIKEMFDLGLENEVRLLIEKFGRNAPGLDSIGYCEWFSYFDGHRKRPEVFEEILINSRQYAKRQETWFKKRPGTPMFDLEKTDSEEKILSQVKSFLQYSG